MALGTYGELKTAVATRLSRSNMTALIPDFITIAQSKMMRGDLSLNMPPLRIVDMMATATLTPADGAASLPSGFLEAVRVVVANAATTPLGFISLESWAGNSLEGIGGTSVYYTIDGTTMRFAPKGDADVSLTYYAALDDLEDDSDTNAVFTKAPHAYLYGALAEAYAHIRQFDVAAGYGAQFGAAIRSLNEDSQQHAFSGATMIMRPGGMIV